MESNQQVEYFTATVSENTKTSQEKGNRFILSNSEE